MPSVSSTAREHILGATKVEEAWLIELAPHFFEMARPAAGAGGGAPRRRAASPGTLAIDDALLRGAKQQRVS